MDLSQRTARNEYPREENQPVLLVPQVHCHGRLLELGDLFLQEEELALPETPVTVHHLWLFSVELLGEAKGSGKVVFGDAVAPCE